jgi:hypothetical protein
MFLLRKCCVHILRSFTSLYIYIEPFKELYLSVNTRAMFEIIASQIITENIQTYSEIKVNIRRTPF